jgi:hypothetical protein
VDRHLFLVQAKLLHDGLILMLRPWKTQAPYLDSKLNQEFGKESECVVPLLIVHDRWLIFEEMIVGSLMFEAEGRLFASRRHSDRWIGTIRISKIFKNEIQ